MVMKPIVYLCLMFFSGLAQARFGVGAQLGFPTGVTAKNWVKSAEAIDATLAWDLGPGNNFLLQSSYLWHKKDYLFFQDKEPLDLYFGLGGRMKFADEIHLGVRAPVGLAHYSKEEQVELFGEVAPVFDLLPDTDWELQLAFGVRIYFN